MEEEKDHLEAFVALVLVFVALAVARVVVALVEII